MSSPAFCTAMPTLWMSEFCLASILSSAAFWARMVLPMSLATLRRLAMIALTCGYTEAAAEVSTEFHKIQIRQAYPQCPHVAVQQTMRSPLME